jgi:hypothetical protein
MSTDKIYVFEVLDNFFGSTDYPSIETLSNRRIHELKEHISDFYNSYRITSLGDFQTRLYLGSFLSSPPISIESAPYLASALLSADSIILFDPLHYWFCDEQYQRPRLISSPTGWKTEQEKLTASHTMKKVLKPNYTLTKKYLAQAIPWLSNIRPLVEAGIVVLIPAEQVVLSEIKTINQFSNGIKARLAPLDKLSDIFEPDEITVEDNHKGLFVFAGGNRELQIQKSIGIGIEHFAKDIIIANATGSLYTAPFRWEQHIGKLTLDGFASSDYEAKIIEGIRNLHLPILSNLSPDMIVKIHQDSGYSLFRTSLIEALQNVHEEIGSSDFIIRVQQIENDILLPKVEAIFRDIKSSEFKRITGAIVEGTFTFLQTFLVNTPTGLDTKINAGVSIVGGGLSFVRELIKSIWTKKDHRIWAQLLPEKPTTSIYGSPLMLKQAGSSSWEIDENPSMSIKVSKGIIKNFL